MKTSSRLNPRLWLVKVGLATILPATMLMFSAQTSMAGNASWLPSGQDQYWYNVNNWTQGGPPNGPFDTATFANSIETSPDVTYLVEVNGIIFTSGASAYTIAVEAPSGLTISGVGITNLSGITQTLGSSGDIFFTNSASAGSRTALGSTHVFFRNNSTAAYCTFNGGGILFYDSSSADNATFTVYAAPIFYDSSFAGNATFSNNNVNFLGNSSAGSATFSCSCCCEVGFFGSSTASNAIFTNASANFSENSTAANGSFLNPGSTGGSGTGFRNFSSAGSATITNNGGTIPGAGGSTSFFNSSTAYNVTITNNFGDTSTAGSATLIANGGTGGERVVRFPLGTLPLAAWHAWRFSAGTSPQ